MVSRMTVTTFSVPMRTAGASASGSLPEPVVQPINAKFKMQNANTTCFETRE
jgi:hypothetical protein